MEPNELMLKREISSLRRQVAQLQGKYIHYNKKHAKQLISECVKDFQRKRRKFGVLEIYMKTKLSLRLINEILEGLEVEHVIQSVD